MTAVKAAAAGEGAAVVPAADLDVLAKLLHALNQPLTGLQCSLELVLSGPRTPEQYVECMRGGLELTERMRNLVGAMRELMEIEGAAAETLERIDLRAMLQETVSELQPVSEAKGVRFELDCVSLPVSAGRRGLTSAVFRAVESALSLAAPGSVLAIKDGADTGWAVRMGWSRAEPVPPPDGFSQAELGLMLAQAGLRRAGVELRREQTNHMDGIRLRAHLAAGNPSPPLRGADDRSVATLPELTINIPNRKDLPLNRNS